MPATRRRAVLGKLGQLWRLVHESHAYPMAGTTREPELVAPGETGITFIGHSSFFLQIGGKNVLVDPVFAKRLILLRRQRRPGLRIPALPGIDVVFVTHAHMDHLNLASLRQIARKTKRLRGTAPIIVVPNGVEDLVHKLGFSRVETMSWWDQRTIEGLDVTMTPCQHWGARMFADTHREFGGYVLESKATGASIYHSGDTAWFNGFREVGDRLHPQIALLPIGAYFPDSHRTVHTNPEEAVRGFLETGASLMIPMHYGTFKLGREPMQEPVERLAAEATRLHITDKVRVLAEGETLKIPTKQGVLHPAEHLVASR